jgi:hypothetical protein
VKHKPKEEQADLMIDNSDEEAQHEELKKVKVLKIIKEKQRVTGN